jgi:hypothetical protein
MKNVYYVIIALGTLSIIYSLLGLFSFLAMLDGGGTGVILESFKIPAVDIIIVVFITTMLALKPTRKILAKM